MSEETRIAEYEATSNEVLFRMKAQQEIISYSLVAGGLLGTILGLSQSIDSILLLFILLLGPIICVSLEAIYLKHHTILTTHLRFIDFVLGDPLQKGAVFGQRGRFFRETLYQPTPMRYFTAILGFIEGSFPLLIAGAYLIGFLILFFTFRDKVLENLILALLLILFFYFDLLLLLFGIAAGIFTRKWNFDYGKLKDLEAQTSDEHR